MDKWIPEERIAEEFPWEIWAVGWIALVKAVHWLFMDTSVVALPLGTYLFIKYATFLILYCILGIAVWHFKAWAKNGLLALCLLDMMIDAALLISGYPFIENNIMTMPRTDANIFTFFINALVSPISSLIGSFAIVILIAKARRFFKPETAFKYNGSGVKAEGD